MRSPAVPHQRQCDPQELPSSSDRGPERVSLFSLGRRGSRCSISGVPFITSYRIPDAPTCPAPAHQSSDLASTIRVPTSRHKCVAWTKLAAGMGGVCLGRPHRQNGHVALAHYGFLSFFMRSRQRIRGDGKLFTKYLTWHTGGRERERERKRERKRERESLGLAGYVDERECTHYCALAPDNVPGPSCWGSTGRDICGDAGVAF